MNRERIQLLMNRIIDGEANATERAELSRALKADPLLSEEYAQMQLVHRATENLFCEIRLPQNFSKNVMSRLQPRETPSDLATDSVRLPSIRPHSGSNGLNQLAHVRPRKNVFTLVASLASAAAILLTAGIMFANVSGNNVQVQNPSSSMSDADRGVPGLDDAHRTDSSSSGSKRGDAPEINPDASSDSSETVVDNTDPKPDENHGDAVIENEDDKSEKVNPQPEGSRFPEDSENDPVVEDKPDGSTLPEEKPDSVIEREPEGDKEHKTEVKPDNRRKIGQMQVLSGYLLEYVNGDWQKLKDTANIREDSHLKTNVNGIVMLELENGRVTLGKGSEIHLLSSERLEIIDGEVSLSRNSMDSAGSLSVVSSGLTWTQQAGISVIERKRSGLEVQNVLGDGLLFNQENGLLEISGGYEVRASFGKVLKEGRAKRLTLPDWSADGRALYLVNQLAPVLDERGYEAKDRRLIDKNLIKDFSRLLRQPIPSDGLFEALTACIGNQALSGHDLVRIVDEVESALFEYNEISPATLNAYALSAGQRADNFAHWKQLFEHQITPPVVPTKKTSKTSKPPISGAKPPT